MNPCSCLKTILYLLALALIAAQAACTPTSGKLSPDASAVLIRQATTVSARSTGVLALPTTPAVPSDTRSPGRRTPNSPEPSLLTPTPEVNLPALPSSTPGVKAACDKAAPGSPIDVTIIDNTQMAPGHVFTKVWRLVNIGECKWTQAYAAEWFSGDRLGDTLVKPLGAEVNNGDSVDITVDMIAPLTPGTYQSNWKMRNASKEWFGIGPDGDQVFWVKIVVIQDSTDTPFPAPTEMPPTATPTLTLLPTLTITPALTITPTLTPTPSATPAVLISGTVTLAGGDRLDLDTLQGNAGGEDLSFQQDEFGNHWFVPEGGAILGVYGGNTPTLPVCLSANMSAAPIAIESLPPGTYLCFRSGQGLPGWLRYASFNLQDNTLTLEILTWFTP
jgi:hypothetical protein